MKFILFILAVLSTHSSVASEQIFEEKNIIDVCSDKSIPYEVQTDDSSFYENYSIFFASNKVSKVFSLDLFGLMAKKIEKSKIEGKEYVSYFYIKSFDKKTNEEKWLNVDVLTLDPSLTESDLIEKVKEKICLK